MSKWLVLFFLISIAYFSGFIPVRVNEQLLLRNIPSVQGSETQHYGASQIKEIGIGVEKFEGAPLRPSGYEGQEWGTSKQLSEHTWTIKVGQDTKNGSAQEILTALNNYRQRHGKGTLSWNDALANYAKERASYFASRGDLDSHAGFSDFVKNQDGFTKLGFFALGENSSLGYSLEAVHLIEWVYAGDKPHDDNQLNSDWTHVGIGVSGTATNLIFGGKKL